MSRCVFLLLGILIEGVVAVIQTQQTVMAAVGDQASLSCQLSKTKDVLQVTWQKVVPGGEKNLATYTKKFGSRVSAGLEEKMDFQYESLQSCSMVIRRVTGQDEGCYRCLFNSYSEGALIGWTCLKLCELHGPFIDVSRSESPPGSVVTCSATGQPVPMLTLTVLHQNLSFSDNNTCRETNTNGTVTVTTTALLSALSNTQVGCSVSLDSAAPRDLLVIVPGLTDTSDDGLVKHCRSYCHTLHLPLIAAVMSVVVCFAILLGIRFQRSHRNQKPSEDSTENQKMNVSPASSNNLRQRSPEKQKLNGGLYPSP